MYADEWTTLLKQLWTSDGPQDFRGEYITGCSMRFPIRIRCRIRIRC